MRRRAYDSVLASVGTSEQDILEEDELKFLQVSYTLITQGALQYPSFSTIIVYMCLRV